MDWLTHLPRAVFGVAALLAFAYALSGNRRRIDWALVGKGLALQFVIAVLVLKAPFVAGVFQWLAQRFVDVLDSTTAGSSFVFGPLGDADVLKRFFDEPNHVVLAFQAFTVIIFFSALTSVLYYLGVLQWFVMGFAKLMNRLMRLSGAESLSAAGNVFLGQTESPLLIKPYLDGMSRSELMAVMAGGMATIAGSVMALYVKFLGGDDPVAQSEYASFLLCASLMNAPASLVMAKMLVPQTENTTSDMVIDRSKAGSNLLDALSRGTTQGLHLALNVAAMLIAFLALIALLNKGLVAIGRAGEGDFIAATISRLSNGVFTDLSLEAIMGFVFSPIAWIIGVPTDESLLIGQLLGKKMVLNELVAFRDLAALREAGTLSTRSVFLGTFALCGFANFSSIGIQIGGIGVLAPQKRKLLCELGFKAMLAGTLASLMSAALAGILQ